MGTFQTLQTLEITEKKTTGTLLEVGLGLLLEVETSWDVKHSLFQEG